MRRLNALPALFVLLCSTAVDAQETVRISGEVRARGEAERTAVPDTTDAFSLLRTRLGVEALLSPRARVFAQVQDARVFGEETSTTDGTADRIDVHQAWLQYGGDLARAQWSVRVGRQEIALGNERLVGAVGWSNTGRAFDGVRATLGTPRWQASALAATIRELGVRHGGASAGDGDQLFAGAHLQAGVAELFVLHDAGAVSGVYADVDRTTIGGRLARNGGITMSLEAAWQLGTRQHLAIGQDISAYMAGGRLGYAPRIPVLDRIGIGIDMLSGDHAPDDDSYGAFNTLYATNHRFYGCIDLFLDPAARTRGRGLVDGMVSATVALPRNLALEIDGHAFRLHRRMPETASRALGMELDLTLPVRLGPGQQLQLGYSMFHNGRAAPAIGLGGRGDTWHWSYIMATFSFGARPSPVL